MSRVNRHNVEFVRSATRPSDYPRADRPEVAFAGRSNVGKSSLLNTLLNRRRLAKVSRTPGRTQTINFFDVDGSLYFVDLPGYGYAKVSKKVRAQWGPMIETYLRERDTLRAVVVLMDVRRDPSDDDLQLLDGLAELDVPVIPVLTKSDKVGRNELGSRTAAIARAAEIPREALVPFSSKTGRGREALWSTILVACGLDGTNG